MDQAEYLHEKQFPPTFTAGEIYSMLCVADITRKELVELINLIQLEGPRYEKQDLAWISTKVQEVADRLAPRVKPEVKKLYSRSKKALPSSDNKYTDYTQSE